MTCRRDETSRSPACPAASVRCASRKPAWSGSAGPGRSPARLQRLERKAARQKRARNPFERTSNRLHRTYDQIAGSRARAKRRRYDWQHKTTTTIAGRYGIVAVEELRVENMTRSARGTIAEPGRNVRQKAGLNRVMLNEAHARTVELLAYKLAERGGQLLKVPAAYTSQTCSTCGHRDPRSRHGVAFTCTSCGHLDHAATNATLPEAGSPRPPIRAVPLPWLHGTGPRTRLDHGHGLAVAEFGSGHGIAVADDDTGSSSCCGSGCSAPATGRRRRTRRPSTRIPAPRWRGCGAATPSGPPRWPTGTGCPPSPTSTR
ncbi:RNA-guided endonuclease InsQ/TnpB family protein [Micromonospora olivasterospora]|uniref:RNA-guided endonuclease InsQ/TnpB family protein n=1 Tax=Micromonospora olivasterospora TaxID=1880 RepID=UPI0011A7367A